MGHTPPPRPLAAVVADNVKRLRAEKGWSQAQLSRAMVRAGLRTWSPAQIAQVETGRLRADHLLELAALCQVFEAPLAELVAGDEPVRNGGVGSVALETIRLALAGTSPLTEEELAVDDGRYYYLANTTIARRFGLATPDLRAVCHDLWGVWNFYEERDRRIGGDSLFPGVPIGWDGSSLPTVRARRGHATRLMLEEITILLHQETIDQVWERQRQAYTQLLVQEHEAQVQEAISDFFKATGEVPTRDEVEEWLAEWAADDLKGGENPDPA